MNREFAYRKTNIVVDKEVDEFLKETKKKPVEILREYIRIYKAVQGNVGSLIMFFERFPDIYKNFDNTITSIERYIKAIEPNLRALDTKLYEILKMLYQENEKLSDKFKQVSQEIEKFEYKIKRLELLREDLFTKLLKNIKQIQKEYLKIISIVPEDQRHVLAFLNNLMKKINEMDIALQNYDPDLYQKIFSVISDTSGEGNEENNDNDKNP